MVGKIVVGGVQYLILSGKRGTMLTTILPAKYSCHQKWVRFLIGTSAPGRENLN